MERNDGQAEVEAARVDAIEAIRLCRAADAGGTLEGPRARGNFDPTWRAMQVSVVAYTRILRSHGLGAEATLSAIGLALEDAASAFAPHDAIRSAALGWCRRAYFAPSGSSSVIPL